MNDLEKSAVEQKLKTLAFQNTKLTEELESQKRQNAELTGTVSSLEEEQKQYRQNLLCINSAWQRLNADIVSMVDGTAAAAAATAAEPSVSEAADADALADIEDPYLRRLLASDLSAKQKVLAKQKQQDKLCGDIEAVEEQLRERSEGTLTALARVLEALQQQRGHNEALMAAVAGSSADAALQEEHKQLRQQLDALHKQLDGMHAVQRTTDQLAKSASDRLFECEEKRKELENQLADMEYNLDATKRKLARLKQAGGDAGASMGAAAAPATPAGGLFKQGSVSSAGVSAGAAKDGGGSEHAEANEELQAQLQELQHFLEQRTAECDKEKEAHQRTLSELRATQARMQDESWVAQTSTYQAKLREHMGCLAELDRKRTELEGLARERDEALRVRDGWQKTIETEKVLRHRLGMREAEKAELQNRVNDMLQARHELERVLQAERDKLGQHGTVAELKVMVATLQREVMLAQDKLKKEKVSAQRIDDARQEVAMANARVAKREQEVRRLHECLSAKDADAVNRGRREAALKEQVEDLNAFVDACVYFKSDAREAREVRQNEAKLRYRVQDLEQQLKGHELHAEVAAAQKAEADQRKLVEAAQAEADGLRQELVALQQQVRTLNEQVASMKQECDAYISEIEQTSSAYEEMQAQNTRLLQQLTERDEAISGLMAERQRLQHGQEALRGQLEAAKADVVRLGQEVAETTALKEAAEKDLAKASAELTTACEQLRSQASRMDAVGRDAQQKAEAHALLQQQLESAQQAAAKHQKAYDEEVDKGQKERTKRQRCEEENKVLQAKVERLRKMQNSDEAVAELEEETAALRKQLKCTVCSERQKSVIITKCWHVFCAPCIKRNLEMRHRKCPACSAAFGAADVHDFYLT